MTITPGAPIGTHPADEVLAPAVEKARELLSIHMRYAADAALWYAARRVEEAS